MGLSLENLDARTRAFMIQEFESDVKDETLVYSKDFSPRGLERTRG